MRTMRLLFLLLTIWATTTGSTWPQQPHTHQPFGAPPPPPTIASLDLMVAAKYPEFITNMRNALSEKDKKGKDVLLCTMKKISGTIPLQRYAYVDIKASATQTITLAIDRADMYVMGYRDKINGKDRAFFFKEVFEKAKDLFPDAKGGKEYRVKLGFTSQYTDLGDRTKVPLGIKAFRKAITDDKYGIYGVPANSKSFVENQRKFFLIAIQMVAEATRFKYISDKIPTARDYDTLTVDNRVMALENGWDPLSKATYMATNCKLQKPVSLVLDAKNKWVFNSVEEIAQVVALLKAKGSKVSKNNDVEDGSSIVTVASS